MGIIFDTLPDEAQVKIRAWRNHLSSSYKLNLIEEGMIFRLLKYYYLGTRRLALSYVMNIGVSPALIKETLQNLQEKDLITMTLEHVQLNPRAIEEGLMALLQDSKADCCKVDCYGG